MLFYCPPDRIGVLRALNSRAKHRFDTLPSAVTKVKKEINALQCLPRNQEPWLTSADSDPQNQIADCLKKQPRRPLCRVGVDRRQKLNSTSTEVFLTEKQESREALDCETACYGGRHVGGSISSLTPISPVIILVTAEKLDRSAHELEVFRDMCYG